MPRLERHRDDSGQVSVLVIGFAAVLLLAIVVVIDASAAYLQRQGLDTLADGAALRGADLGATGEDVYRGGVTDDDLELTTARARQAVQDYLADVGAHRKYPGLTAHVTVTDTTVEVRLTAPVDLPFSIPGSPDHPTVGAAGAAVVNPDEQ
jgi:uncharacterized membrane protein